jgi:hypothetical protein
VEVNSMSLLPLYLGKIRDLVARQLVDGLRNHRVCPHMCLDQL